MIVKVVLFSYIVLFSTILILPYITYIPAQESDVIQLYPTDDAITIINLSNPNEIISNFTAGNTESLKILYSYDSTSTDPNFTTLGYLKFNLSDVDVSKMTSATLNLNSFEVSIGNNTLPIFKANSNDWNEETLNVANRPSFSNTPIDVATGLSSLNWVSWNVTNALTQVESDITFVIGLNDYHDNSIEGIDFHSKESPLLEIQPFLELTFDDDSKQSQLTQTVQQDQTDSSKQYSNYSIKKIPVTEDAYVGANYANLQGFEDMRNINTGNFNFTKIWYSYNATGTEEFFISSGFLKFDISELNPKNVVDAQLKIYNNLMSTSGADRILSVFLVDNSTWSESELTFDNKPKYIKRISTVQIDEVDNWVSWNVTDTIKQSNSTELTLSIIYDVFIPGHEEQTVFNSKEASENTPYLEIIYDDTNEGGGCLIATATYGSEMAPQVQQLRELRDNHLLQTESGTVFMSGFNQFYYSFSPYIADLERENPLFKDMVKLSLTPLLTSLSILNHVDMNSEESVLGYGISLILFNLGVYFVAPIILFWNIKNYIKKN